jgi:uncharacterized protein GlcG (DUF336 family)
MTRIGMMITGLAAAALAAMSLSPVSAQLAERKILTLAQAKKLLAAAEAEAVRNRFVMCIAVVDEAGNLLTFERMDEAELACIRLAEEKARTAVLFKRPTKQLDDQVSGARSAAVAMGFTPVEGGVPLTSNGKVVGAIGASGGTSVQDQQVAAAAAEIMREAR